MIALTEIYFQPKWQNGRIEKNEETWRKISINPHHVSAFWDNSLLDYKTGEVFQERTTIVINGMREITVEESYSVVWKKIFDKMEGKL